ncbi:MAG: hypothetical protein IJ432_01475, partial [Clostridia bacterium]|nr:hypothetical protein [Clostridia bacterium]
KEDKVFSSLVFGFCWSYIDTLVSGSPIIQNGKLIGALTHVLVDDPQNGYGIFAENMLSNAQTAIQVELKEAS